MHSQSGRVDPVKRQTRWLAAVVILFLADAAQLLLLLPARTDELFAWPIKPEVSALVLGSAYVGGGYYFVRVLFADAWHRVAAGFPAVIAFVWMASAATVLHFDRLTQDGVSFLAWVTIYVITPVGLPLFYLAQRGSTLRTSMATGLPVRERVLLGGIGAAVIVAGVVVFAAPDTAIDVWPWTVTPLTVRVLAAVVVLFGSVWVSVAAYRSELSAKIPMEAHGIGLACLLLAGVRGGGAVEWSDPLAVIFVAVVTSMLVVDVAWLVLSARRQRR